LYDQFGETIEKLTEKAGAIGNAQTDNSMIGKLLRDLDQQIYRKEDLLIKKENNYYKQFAAMEKAMSKYNSQSSWFAQQFGGGM
jgi:flagellar hook-associated protein 2